MNPKFPQIFHHSEDGTKFVITSEIHGVHVEVIREYPKTNNTIGELRIGEGLIESFEDEPKIHVWKQDTDRDGDPAHSINLVD